MIHSIRAFLTGHLPVPAICLLVALAASGCSQKQSEKKETGTASQIERSVPEVVVQMIDAHGGMAPWRAAPTVSFEDVWISPGEDQGEISRVTVDQATRRAYVDYPGSDKGIVWDGTKAWSMHWDSGMPPRFLALLTYYFVNLPWLTMDPGVKLSFSEMGSLWDGTTEYHIVHMTFMPGTGDTPDDYYRLYIDQQTHRLKACDYVVTYSALLPDSVAHTPEHQLVYEEWETVDGLVVPTKFTIYGKPGEVMATCSLKNWAFDRPFDESRMTMPDSAVVDTTRP